MPAAVRATTDFFDQLTNDLLGLRVVAQQRFRPLSAEELNRRPGPSRWSAGQCLEHLNIVGGYYLPLIAKRIARAQQRDSAPAATAKQGYLGRRFIEAMRAPVSARAYASPQRYAPTGTRLPRTVAEVFSRQLDELLRLVLLARQVNANAVRIPTSSSRWCCCASRTSWSSSWCTFSGTWPRPTSCWPAWPCPPARAPRAGSTAAVARLRRAGRAGRAISSSRSRWP